jgi:acetyl-CoA carboxylase biotin carboxyl carrier protein
MGKTTDSQSDVEFISALAELLRKNDLSELEVSRESGEDNSLTVRVARQGSAPVFAAPTAAPTPAPAPVTAAPAAAPASTAAAAAPATDPAQDPNAVSSPMVGTVYLQAEPGTPAFVSVGDKIDEGQTILIIEAMKTMNQIPAPRSGVVKRILVEDGSPVEFGAPLMILE